MKANLPKTIGIKGGTLRDKPVPTNPEYKTDKITWIEGDNYAKILGIPFWEREATDSFWNKLYLAIKAIIGRWNRHTRLTPFGRANLANAMIYSRIRYVAQTIVPPEWFMMAIREDIQALVWARDYIFIKDEIGAATEYTRWMKDGAETGKTRVDFGLSLIDWPAHMKALRTRALLRYLDASQGPWKLLLDEWFARDECLERGAVLSTVDIKDLTQSTTYMAPRLPKFWCLAIKEARSLGLAERPHTSTPEGARSIPVWDSPSFPAPKSIMTRAWIELGLKCIRDTFKPDNSSYSRSEIEDEVRAKLKMNSLNQYLVRKDDDGLGRITLQWAPFETIWQDWEMTLRSIPKRLRTMARTKPVYLTDYGPAVRIMRKMGWKGGGLGTHETGRTQPITAPKKGKRTALLERHVCAIHEGTIIYGLPREGGDTVQVELSVRGRPIRRDNAAAFPGDPSNSFRPAIWGEGLNGIKEYSFPAPKEWTFRHCNAALDTITVKQLTQLFRLQSQVLPSCTKLWEQDLGHPIRWEKLKEMYSTAFLGSKDIALHFRHILHRRFYTRVKQRQQDTSCRCCGKERETTKHLGTCPALQPLREWLMAITEDYSWGEPETFLLGPHPQAQHTPGGCNLWLLLWGALIRNLVKMSTEDARFDPKSIIKNTVENFANLCKVQLHRANVTYSTARAREKTPSVYRHAGYMLPMATIMPSETGPPVIRWCNKLLEYFDENKIEGMVLGKYPAKARKKNSITFVKGSAPPN